MKIFKFFFSDSRKGERAIMKLAPGISIFASLGLIVLYGILVGIMVPGWKNSAKQLWDVAATETRDNIIGIVNSTLEYVQFAARAVPQLEPALSDMMIANVGYDPKMLLRSFAAFNEFSTHRFGSFGFIRKANPAPGRRENAKVSWQIAANYGCPTYMYAYSDELINPAFHGYCGNANGTVEWNRRVYSGTDWGLKPQEVALLDGSIAPSGTFLPIFELLGGFTLTFELAYPQTAPAYAITFAELNLTTLSNHINQKVKLVRGSIAYIFENPSGGMIASTVPDTLIAPNGTRYTAHLNPDSTIRQTATGSASDWIVLSTRRLDVGLNWTVVVAVRDYEIYGGLNHAVTSASLIGLGVLAAVVLILWLGIHCCISRQSIARKEGTELPYSMFEEGQ
jgi:hypothetical protein